MIITPLTLKGAFLIEQDRHRDNRGFFARTFCKEEFQEKGLVVGFIQMSMSHNAEKGQIRGMHYQESPHEETKIIRCTKGSVFDVIVDMRSESPTYMKWHGENLSADNGKALYAPKGFAHGYKTLEDDTELLYMMDAVYAPESAREIDHLDAKININWG